jgi:hypothetical protein
VIWYKKQSIGYVDNLLKDYPDSIWKDDARMLKMEVAAELALLGDQDYQHFIQETVTRQNKDETELMFVAMEALVQLGPEIALPLMESVLNEQSNPEVRKMAVKLIGMYHGEEALLILRHFEAEDSDEGVRKEAEYWRKQIQMLAIPVQLNYYGFVARLEEDQNLVPENQLNEYDFPALASPGKRDVEKHVKAQFEKKLSVVKFAAMSTLGIIVPGELPAYTFNTRTAHNLAGFRVEVPGDALKKSYFNISGTVSFFDKYTDREYTADFIVDADDAKLFAMRHGEEVAILVVLFESNEEPLDIKGEPEYYTEINNVFGSVVHSSRQTWDMDEFKATVVEYGRAKAEIPGDTGIWTLVGDIQLVRSAKQFVARNAVLYDPKHEIAAEAPEIRVPVDDPSKFEVTGKQ